MGIVYSLYHFPQEKLPEYKEAGPSGITNTIEKDLPIAKVTHHPSRVIPARQARNPKTGELVDIPETTTLARDYTQYKQTLYIDKSWPFIEKLILPFSESYLPLLGNHAFFTPEKDPESCAFYLTSEEVVQLNNILQQMNTDEIASKLALKPELAEDTEEWFDYAESYFNKIKTFYQEAANNGHMIASIAG